MQFVDYDKITDTLLYLSQNITMSFHVVLSRKDKQGKRVFFHYETAYNSKFIGSDTGHSIKRNMNFYFTIDNKNDFANGFILRQQDVMLLVMAIEKMVLPWFFGNGKERIFSIVDNKLVITGNFTPLTYTQSEIKFLRFTPFVLSYPDGTYKEGIRITLNYDSEYADMDIDKFMGFYGLLKNTDMYGVACSMVTYAKLAPYGLNIFAMSGLGGGYIPDQWGESAVAEESPQPKQSAKNFLSSLDNKKS